MIRTRCCSDGFVTTNVSAGSIVRAQHPFVAGQGALVYGPGGGQLALVLEQAFQVVEAGGGVAVVWSQRPPVCGQRSPVARCIRVRISLGLTTVGTRVRKAPTVSTPRMLRDEGFTYGRYRTGAGS